MLNTVANFLKKSLVDLCWKLIQLNSEKPVFNSSKLPDLCPTDNAENCEEYIDRLNELLINRLIRIINILVYHLVHLPMISLKMVVKEIQHV